MLTQPGAGGAFFLGVTADDTVLSDISAGGHTRGADRRRVRLRGRERATEWTDPSAGRRWASLVTIWRPPASAETGDDRREADSVCRAWSG